MESADKQIKTTAKKPIYDGTKSYKIGDPIELSQDEYEAQLAANAVDPVKVVPAEENVEDAPVLTRVQELEELTVPALQKMAEALEIDTVPKRKAEIINAIIQAEEVKAAGN